MYSGESTYESRSPIAAASSIRGASFVAMGAVGTGGPFNCCSGLSSECVVCWAATTARASCGPGSSSSSSCSSSMSASSSSS